MTLGQSTTAVRGGLLADPAVPARRGSRRAAIAVLVFLATLPLQFESLGEFSFGEFRYFHLGAVAMVLLNLRGMRAIPAVLGELWTVVVAMLTLTIIAVVSALSYGGSGVQPVQHLIYCAVGIAFLLTLRDALRDDSGRALLIWASPVTVVVTLVELVLRVAENGLDLATVLRATFVDLDPNVLIYGVFRQGTDTGEVVQPANIRHEIMGAVVVAVLVTLLAEHRRRYARVVAAAATVAGGALVIMSLSRSVLLPLMIVALGAGIRVWLKLVLSKTALVGVVALVLAAPFVGSLLYERFVDETGSYEERLGAFSYSTDELLLRILAGGPPLERVEDSTHTLVFDVLFQAGWLAGLAAVVVVVVFAKYTLAAYSRYFRSGSVVELVAFAAGTLLIVRAFTIGGGYLHQVGWVEFGIVLALAAGVAARHTVADSAGNPVATPAGSRTGRARSPLPDTTGRLATDESIQR